MKLDSDQLRSSKKTRIIKRKIKSVGVTLIPFTRHFVFPHELVFALHVTLFIDMAIIRQIMVVDEAHWFWIIIRKYCFSHLEWIYQWQIQTLKYRKRPPPTHPNRDFRLGTGGDPWSQINFLGHSSLSLFQKKKWGGGGGSNPLDPPLFITAFLFLYFYFFLQQVILRFATSYELVKGSFFTVELLGN